MGSFDDVDAETLDIAVDCAEGYAHHAANGADGNAVFAEKVIQIGPLLVFGQGFELVVGHGSCLKCGHGGTHLLYLFWCEVVGMVMDGEGSLAAGRSMAGSGGGALLLPAVLHKLVFVFVHGVASSFDDFVVGDGVVVRAFADAVCRIGFRLALVVVFKELIGIEPGSLGRVVDGFREKVADTFGGVVAVPTDRLFRIGFAIVFSIDRQTIADGAGDGGGGGVERFGRGGSGCPLPAGAVLFDEQLSSGGAAFSFHGVAPFTAVRRSIPRGLHRI